jgi:hypothetical protein
VAKSLDLVSINIFTRQCQTIESLDITIALEFSLLEQIGETAETLPEHKNFAP